MELRKYQEECIEAIEQAGPGNWLCQMATGLGKTVTFANIPRKGRTLILSHRRELVHQPRKYFSCSFGVELGEERSHGEEVISASVQTLSHRLERFHPDDFDTIIWDEAHHTAAPSYRKIFGYFTPRRNLGFTATPNRTDGIRLDDVFQDIIFQRDLRWGIENGYLSDIYCRRVDIGFDLRGVSTRGGDYAPGELEEAMEGTEDAIAQAYRELAEGATLIFAVSVRQAEAIAERIPGAVTVTGGTEPEKRKSILEAFTSGKRPCIVNCMVFTEGTDIPRVETVIIARPTQSDSLYAQMVGRGLRLYPGKEKLNLIDCVGITGKRSLCTAPSLLGIDLNIIPDSRKKDIQGLLFELPEKAAKAADCPESWIRNIEIVDLWAKGQKYDTHNVNWFRMPDGSLVCSLLNRNRLVIPPQDDLGRVRLGNELVPIQKALDRAFRKLRDELGEQEYLWNLQAARKWGKKPASEKQLQLVNRICKGFDTEGLTKLEASQILNRLLNGRRSA